MSKNDIGNRSIYEVQKKEIMIGSLFKVNIGNKKSFQKSTVDHPATDQNGEPTEV